MFLQEREIAMTKRQFIQLFILSLALLLVFSGCSEEKKAKPVEEKVVEAKQEPVVKEEPVRETVKKPKAEDKVQQVVKETVAQAKIKPASGKKVITANFLMPAKTADVDWLGSEYFVMDWLVLGPFEYDGEKYGGEWECQEAIEIACVENEAKLTPREGAEVSGKYWQRLESYGELIDLDAFYEYTDFATAYIGAYVYSPTEMKDCILYLGSDDYVKVYINEELVYTYKTERRGAEVDSDRIPGINLKQGWNKVVIKVVDVVQGWGVYVRFADWQNKPFKVMSK